MTSATTGRGSERGARSVVVTVGDELLLGRTVDTNATWLADRLAVLGVPVTRMESVGDEDGAITEAVGRAVRAADLVVVTGGLGPTEDDRTLPAVRRALGGVEPDELVENTRGRQPGRWFDPDDTGYALLVLPGPPREMKAVFHAAEPIVRASLGELRREVSTRSIATTGIPESKLAPLLQPRIDVVEAVEIAFLPDLDGVNLRLTVRDVEPEIAHARLDEAEAGIEEIVRPYRISAPSGDLVEELTHRLLSRGWTLALGESCTGGGVAARMTSLPGASQVVVGGVVAYANSAKEGLLRVPGDLITTHGAVSEPVAEAMARGAADLFETECAIGITGIAGPDGGTDEKPVGTVCYAALTPEVLRVTTRRFVGDREAVQRRSGQAALFQLLRTVEAAV